MASGFGVVDAPLIATSPRKHRILDHDMIHPFNQPMFVDDLDDCFVMFVGSDTSGTNSWSSTGGENRIVEGRFGPSRPTTVAA